MTNVRIFIDYMTSLIRCTFCEYNTNMYTIRSRSLRPNIQELKEMQGFEVFDSLMIKYSLNHLNYCSPTQNIRVFCVILSFFGVYSNFNTMMTTTTCVLRTNQDRIYMEFDTFSLPERAF